MALDWNAGPLLADLAVLGWEAVADGAAPAPSDVRLLAAIRADALIPHLPDPAVPVDAPILCLADADAAAESTLLRAGAHMVLPLSSGAGAVAVALDLLARLAAPANRAVRAGDLALHVDRRVALCRGRPLALAPLDFDLLLLLAERMGQVVPAADLRARLWPNLAPDAPGAADRLAAHIRSLRRALGTAVPLHTRGRRGYQLGVRQLGVR